jgi:cellulose synthase/poly-beta-1,6-N-acetylglucosamine synthase-like glycosyltransferase
LKNDEKSSAMSAQQLVFIWTRFTVMLFLKIVFASLFFIPPLMLILPGILCLLRLRAGERESEGPAPSAIHSHVDILLPLGGIIPDQEKILTSLLEQDHPNYRMLFIVDDEEDPVNPLINELCDRYPHAVKIVAGIGGLCAQKNHCLVKGLSNLAPETDIVVFCDGSNIADTGWLKRITYRVESGQVEVRTTHRAFNPIPHTLGGLCQAVYGSVILLGTQLVTYPWGGGTAIKRSLFGANQHCRCLGKQCDG